MDFLNLDIVLNLLGDMALIALVAYLLGRSRFIASCVNLPMNIRHWFVLTVIFSILSILGTYNGIPIKS